MEDNENQDAIPLFAQGFLISPLEDGGLALSLTYSGSENQARNQTQKNKNKGAQTLPQQFKNPQLESFKKRLKKVPATKQINIEVEVALNPKQKPSTLKTNKNKEGTKSAFANAVLEQEKALSTTTFERSFILISSDEETRQNQLEDIFNGLNNVLQNAGQDYQVKMSLKASTPTQDPTTLQQAETGPSSISTMRNNSKAGYNPYMVGNDMGLWVAGKGWIRFMEDILPSATVRFEENKNFENSLLLALTYLTLGQGQEAITLLETAQTQAQNAQERALAYLAQGTAFVVMGDEAHAKEFYALALKEDPENKIIKSNIAILED